MNEEIRKSERFSLLEVENSDTVPGFGAMMIHEQLWDPYENKELCTVIIPVSSAMMRAPQAYTK
jgi:hypothetical protein